MAAEDLRSTRYHLQAAEHLLKNPRYVRRLNMDLLIAAQLTLALRAEAQLTMSLPHAAPLSMDHGWALQLTMDRLQRAHWTVDLGYSAQ